MTKKRHLRKPSFGKKTGVSLSPSAEQDEVSRIMKRVAKGQKLAPRDKQILKHYRSLEWH